ncbi:hypothetical protein [Gordonia shandongensis]|nr:hypothetical protein [Gordonia shandongensis]
MSECYEYANLLDAATAVAARRSGLGSDDFIPDTAVEMDAS